MSDRITANLPSRDFQATAEFYGRLGFEEMYRDEHWMILRRGTLEVEFFPHPNLAPEDSWFSACVRVNDLDRLFDAWSGAWEKGEYPARMTPIEDEPPGMRSFNLIDRDG